MYQAQLLASRLIKVLDESIEANISHMVGGVTDFNQYWHLQGSTMTMQEFKKRVEEEVEKLTKSEADDDDN